MLAGDRFRGHFRNLREIFDDVPSCFVPNVDMKCKAELEVLLVTELIDVV